VRSDRVNAQKFYAWAASGTFYVSTNRGQSFTAGATGLPTGSVYFKAVPGREGDIWLTTGYGGLYHSTNSGTAFTRLANVTEAYTVGFGRAAPGQTYPAVYLNGIVDGVNGLFRSDDAGASWLRINDDAHQWGWLGRAITGDPRVYGRVYVSTNGRGVVYGDRTGGTTPPTSTTTTTRPPTTTTSRPPTTTTTTSRPPTTTTTSRPPTTTTPPTGGACTATYAITNTWSGGFQGEVTVRAGTTAINGWTVRWTYANGQVISQLWSGTYTQTGSSVTVRNVDYNGSLGANATATFGFLASQNGTNAVPALTCTSP
jgi:hypothetical protein